MDTNINETMVGPENTVESNIDQQILTIHEKCTSLSSRTASVPEGLRAETTTSTQFPYRVQILATGDIKISVHASVGDDELQTFTQLLGTINPDLVDDLDLGQYDRSKYGEAEIDSDVIYLFKEHDSSTIDCELALSGKGIPMLTNRLKVIEQLAPKKDDEKAENEMGFHEDVIHTLDQLDELRKGRIELEKKQVELSLRVEKMIEKYQTLHPRVVPLSGDGPERQVLEAVEELADTNVRRTICQEELRKIDELMTNAKEAGISTMQVSGTDITIDVERILDDDFWDSTMPQIQAQIGEKGYELVHNMKSVMSILHNIENGVASERILPDTMDVDDRNRDILGPYLNARRDLPAEIAFTMLAVDMPRYKKGSMQGGDFVQIRFPLTDELKARTVFFPKDTGNPDRALDVRDMSVNERSHNVYDYHAAQLLFCIRHMRFDLEEKISGQPVSVGDFNLVEGNTLGPIHIDGSTVSEIRFSEQAVQSDNISTIEEALQKKDVPFQRDSV